MYWRDHYPTVQHAMRAERLGDLGKVKLSVAQKQAIAQAKADAKVAKVAGKAKVVTAKYDLKAGKVANKLAVNTAKSQSKVAVYAAKTGAAAAPAAESSAFNSAMTALQSALPGSDAGFAPTSSGGASFAPAPYQPSQDAAAAAPGLLDSIPLVAWIAAGGVVLFLVMRK